MTINEMAKPTQQVMREIYNSEEQRIQNLMMIYIYGGQTVGHWIDELFGACHKVSRLKSSNKFPSQAQLEDWLWYSWADSYYDWLLALIDAIEIKERRRVGEFDKEELYKFMRDYSLFLAKELSSYGQITHKKVEEFILNELGGR